MDGEKVTGFRSVRNLVCAALASALMWSAGSAADTPRGPSGCPVGVSEKEFVCFTLAEEAARQKKEARLEHDLAVAPKPRRFARLWATAGAEYLPNDQTYHPYAIGGVAFGRVAVWAGFFGDTPATGVGFNF